MAARRMFAKSIIESDAFTSLSKDAQLLYIHLGLDADDDGFCNNPKAIQRSLGFRKAALDELIDNRFLLSFDSGIVAIKHWRINNYIQKDRYKPTVHQEEYAQIRVKDNGSYTECIQDVYSLDTQYRIGKDSTDKDSIDKNSKDKDSLDNNDEETSYEEWGVDPNNVSDFFDDMYGRQFMDIDGHWVYTDDLIKEIEDYISEKGYYTVNAKTFFDYYSSRKWIIDGKVVYKQWRSILDWWEKKNREKRERKAKTPQTQFHQFQQRTDGFYEDFIKQVEGGN